tara:strand:- start:618 stop:1559 length:942 start_codon:yes stop_codon:yes gene_type:complete
MNMNEIQENIPEEQETVSFDFDDDNSAVVSDDVPASSEKEETRTIVRESDDGADSDDLENYSDNVKKRINQLTAKRKQAIEEAEAAYTYAQQVQQQNEEMKKRLSDLDKGYINEYGSRIESQSTAAKRMLQEAYDNGDMEKMAQAQEIISGLTIEKERLRIQKSRSERQIEAEAKQAAQPTQQAPQQPRQLDRKLTGWMEKNPWFGDGGDLVMTRGAQAIHEQIVINEGFDPNSDEYYQEIDRRMRREFPHKFQDKRQNAQAVTPASSGRSATKSGRKKTVELTPGQVAFANKMKIPLERYAQEVAKLERKKA